MAMTVIMMEQAPYGRGLLSGGKMPRPPGRVDKQQILATVIVVIQEGHSAAHGFGQQLVPVGAVVVDKMDARRFGDVGELGYRDFVV